ncbi:MAG: PAS domain S-box protein [Ignavibacteriaceae bacterium]|nr:PAS domain S-box protein [Ignavibacteriaceae bacterium]
MKSNIVIVASTVIVLTIITFLLFDLHNSTDDEIIKRFNAQQITATNQIAREIKSFLCKRAQGIEILVSLASLQHQDIKPLVSEVQNFFGHVKENSVKVISVYDDKGTIIYSTAKAAIGRNYGQLDYFQWAMKKENKGKQFISSLIQKTENKTEPLPYFRFLIVSPIYQVKSNKFVGIVTETIDLKEVLSAFLPLVSPSVVKENVWILDKDGTVLFQSEHPEMVLRNIKKVDESCNRCHTSFDYVERILSSKNGSFEYELKDKPKKLASFTTLAFKNISWTLVLNLPSEEVTGFLDNHNRSTLLLISLIAFAFMGGTLLIVRSNLQKSKIETELEKFRSKRTFSLILENAGEGIFGLDLDGYHTFVNPAAADLLGYKIEELVGKYSHSIWHYALPTGEPYPCEDCHIYATLHDGTSHSGEEYFWRKDRTGFPVDFSTTPILENGKVVGAVVIFRDITERKMSQEAIKQQLGFANALNEIADVIISSEDSNIILEKTTDILGETLDVDRCLIYDVNFPSNQLTAFSEWLNPNYSDIQPTKGVYPVDVFISGITEMRKTKQYLASHFDNINPILLKDNSDKILHEQMSIRSGLWYPFAFYPDGYHLLVLNETHQKREWTKEEVDFLNSLSHQVNISLEKIRLLETKRHSEEEIRMLAASLKRINECVSITDVENTILFVNEAFLKTYGYSEEEVLGKNITIVSSLKSPQKAVEEVLPATLQGGWNGELFNKRKDGSEFPIYLSTTVIEKKDGGPNYLIGIAIDITERKRAEQEIVSQKNRFAQLFDNSPIAIALLDDQDKIVHINESFSALFGYYLEEIKGKFINDLIVPPGLKEEAKSYSEQTRVGNQVNKESYRKKKDGSLAYVQIIGVPVTVNDKTVGIYGMYVDMTQRKEAEEKMRTAKELAELANKLKDAFINNMSHEIRTPLNGILGMSGLIKENYSQYMVEDDESLFTGIDSAAQRIIRTVDMILNYSRLQTGEFTVIPKEINLLEICERIINQNKDIADKKNLGLIFNNSSEEGIIIGDDYSITQAVSNLIDNAVKYTQKGFVSVSLLNKSDDELILEIKDSGIGISEEYLEHLFEPYRQEEMGYGRSYEGLGLGLSLVKKFLDLNNAHISVVSKKGEGTTFAVTFTKAMKPKKETTLREKNITKVEPLDRAQNRIPSQACLVLIVEDDVINQVTINRLLKNLYNTLIVSSSDEALDVLKKNKVDMILMDISISGSKNGLELTKELKASKEYQHIPVIAVTAHAFDKDRQNALAAGCDEYLAKPFTKESLLEMIHTLIA